MTREEAIGNLIHAIRWNDMPKKEALDMAIQALKQEPKTGHWIFDEILDNHYYCSECKSMGVDYWDFCPYWGTKMVEPQESEEV